MKLGESLKKPYARLSIMTFSSEKKNKECQVLTKKGIKHTELY